MKLSANKILFLIIFSLFAINLSSCNNTEYGEGTPGELVWRTFLQQYDKVNSSPAVVEGNVYVGSGHRNDTLPGLTSGSINCIDAESGLFVWRKLYSNRYGNPDYVWSSPAIVNGKLYLHDGAYDAGTGEEIWELEIKTPAVANGYVYLTSQAGITCVADNRTMIWETGEGYTGHWADPTVYDGKVYSRNENGKVACFDGLTGTVIWEFMVEVSNYYPPLSASNGRVFFQSLEDEKMFCLNADNGTELWSYSINRPTDAKPSIINQILYISSVDNLFSLNIQDGSENWVYSYETPYNFEPSPALTDKYVYVGVEKSLLCLNRQTGEKVWSYETEDSVDSSPAVVDGKVYFGSDDGWLYCIKALEDEDGYWPMYGYNPARTGSADEE